MRYSIESIPRDGQFVIVADASGNDDVVRWSAESQGWTGLDGEPTDIVPAHWWPMPSEGAPAPAGASPGAGLRLPRAAGLAPPRAVGGALPRMQADARTGLAAGQGNGPSTMLRPRERATRPLRGYRSRPLVSVALLGGVVLVALLSAVASAIVTAGIFRADSVSDFRAVLASLHSFDSWSAPAEPPTASQRATEAADPSRSDRPGDADASLKAAMEQAAAAMGRQMREEGARSARRDVATTGTVRSAATSLVDEAPRANPAEEAPRASPADEPQRVSHTNEPRRANGSDEPQHASLDEPRPASLTDEPGRASGSGERPLARLIDDARARGEGPALLDADRAAEPANLLARASGLLRRGDIGAARLVLAFAHERGSARAGFMLAETYDPRMLAAWAAQGTRADVVRARQLYAKALADGIGDAKARLDALPD